MNNVSINFFADAVCDAALCRIANGEPEALNDIYQKLGRQIYMLAYSILQDTHRAEDVMQETFVRLLSGAKSYQKGTNAKAYILKITRNLAISELQKRSREELCEYPIEESVPDTDAPPLSCLESLSLLRQDERIIVILKLDCGETHKKIAGILGISTAACEKKYRRALEKLKEYYKD